MSTKKREILKRNPVSISPVEVVVEAGNWEGSSSFAVHNSADEVLCQIQVKISVDREYLLSRLYYQLVFQISLGLLKFRQ